jgi:hypothetical protein
LSVKRFFYALFVILGKSGFSAAYTKPRMLLAGRYGFGLRIAV